jgi:hypothetical protein
MLVEIGIWPKDSALGGSEEEARQLQLQADMRFLTVLAALVPLACQMDAGDPPLPQSGNALGQLCTTAGNCPANHDCVFLSAGNPAQGYCSPICTVVSDCANGYTGPTTGQLSCFVPNNADACSIGCQTDVDCPQTLACKAPMGAPFKFCATR